MDPVTGFFRNGSCDTCAEDRGSHTVCAIMDKEFLMLSQYLGNDLSPHAQNTDFGVKARGSLVPMCGAFLQAYEEGCAPKVVLEATHARALDIVPLDVLKECEFNPA